VAARADNVNSLAGSLVAGLRKPGTPHVHQVGIVVADRERAVTQYTHLLGLTDWRLSDFDERSAERTTVRRVETPLTMLLAFAGEEPEIELIQPVGERNIYHEWLRDRGEGIHHLAVVVASLEPAMSALAAAGFTELQAGYGFAPSGTGGFAYFDTVAELGTILEIVEMP
jgi:catechol 2,3-dioxygenase-like lactoylglutathione lyase family enzyme